MKNRFTAAQKNYKTEKNLHFQVGDRVYFKKQNNLEKWDLKWRPGYRNCPELSVKDIFLHIENQATGKSFDLATLKTS